jgi:hypothetical protein
MEKDPDGRTGYAEFVRDELVVMPEQSVRNDLAFACGEEIRSLGVRWCLTREHVTLAIGFKRFDKRPAPGNHGWAFVWRRFPVSTFLPHRALSIGLAEKESRDELHIGPISLPRYRLAWHACDPSKEPMSKLRAALADGQ